MGSFNESGRGRDGSRKGRGRGRAARPSIDSLESRLLLTAPPTWKATSADFADIKNGPLANAGSTLIKVYQDYQAYTQTGAVGNFSLSSLNSQRASGIKFLADYVGVTIQAFGDVTTYTNASRNLGLVIGGIDAGHKVVEGLIPIANLPALAALRAAGGTTGTTGLLPQVAALTRSQGAADNQGEQALVADVAKTQFSVTGAGVTVGVLSDSANRFQGGLAASAATGDIPTRPDGTPNVNNLFDGDAAGPTDEGRAMLEHIYDIAPGAGLAFHSAFSLAGGETVMAQGIRRLASEAGAKVIVDDVGFLTENYYQDGIAATAINDVTAQGVSYFSAAGNDADNGFESPFRGVTGTVAGLGAGRYMNWDPSGSNLLMPVTVTGGGFFGFQYDQPWFVTNGVTSDVDIFLLNADGTIAASGTTNNIATGQALETPQVAAGTYNMVIRVNAGSADPGRVAIYTFFAAINPSRQFGNTGGISYPTTFGHPTANNANGIGAVAWFVTPAFPGSAVTPTPSEDFSSFGPSVKVFNADGSRKAVAEIQQKPDFSGADAANTTFFGSGPGAVPPNLAANDNTLPNFFGTSAAAPNVAAIAALQLQLSPNTTPAQIKTALRSSTIPLNGQQQGQWDVQGGFGLVQATRALAAVDNLRVVSTSPAVAQGLTAPPRYLVVTFNRDVDVKTLNPSDLVFTAFSVPGLTISVSQPLVDLANLRVVFFPLTFNLEPGAKASGAYAYTLKAGSILATDGKPLVGFDGSFGVFDTIAPKVVNTSVLGRFVNVTFSEDINPASITKNNFYLIRTGASGVFGSPTNVIINQDPRLKIGYDVASRTAVLDFSGLDQAQLPSDRYAIVVLDTVTDVVGNKLDGEFGGIFPSGNNKEGGNFTQDLGVRVLTAPQILSLQLDPTSDSGILGDSNTNTAQPIFTGQVTARFPTAANGLTVVAQFNSINDGTLDLNLGLNGRGFTGSFDVTTVTGADGKFSFQAPANLPSGFQIVRVVVVGASDSPPLPGLSTLLDTAFRIDINSPILTTNPNSLQQNAKVSSLATVVIDATDPVIPSDLGNPLAIPTQFKVPALNPATASNISNYALVNLGTDNAVGGTGTAADTDFSNFITQAVYANVGQRLTTADPYRGSITLSFAPGLPSGKYNLIARRPTATTTGITDAAANGIFINSPGGPLAQDFVLSFDLQPTPAYITQVQAVTQDPLGGPMTFAGPRSFFELAVPGTTPRADAPPNQFWIDFSNPLDRTRDYTDTVQLIRTANTAGGASDGDFGTDSTFQSGIGYTKVAGTTVTLMNSVLGAEFGEPGFQNRLVLSLPAGTSLPADHYRLYLPNQTTATGQDLRIIDQFSNHLDGEFLGNLTPNGDGTYETLLPTGEIRPMSVSGDNVPGGAFTTGYTVVPNGNVIFARPDYLDDPNLSGDDPDGSALRPYSTLASEAEPNAINGGALNSVANFSDPATAKLDRNGNGRFDRSAFVAAASLSSRGPVVIVAQPSATVASKTFVIQAASGVDPDTNIARDGSATVPFNTTLSFDAGSILKFFNASLFVQNQGSSIQVRGGPNPLDKVIFTSYRDDTAGGDTNGDGTLPTGSPQGANGGDWGGIVLRNYDDTSNGGRNLNVAPGPDDPFRTKLGLSGADESRSYFDHAVIRFAGGSVPQTQGFRFDAITNFNTRPSISNVTISQTGGGNSAQAAISGDVDSFREDDLARGILVRRADIFSNSINGIFIRAELSGVAEPTDATFRTDNPSSKGGTQNYSFFAPVPYVLVSRLVIGQTLIQDSNGQTRFTNNRFYFQPGTVVKFQRGAAIDQVRIGSSLNIGDRTYINQFDQSSNLSPSDPGFRPPNFGDAPVVFTSFFDDNATSAYRDPNTGVLTTVVAPLDSDNGGAVNLPVAGNVPPLSRWGGISVTSGAIAVIDEATFQFGGGSVNSTGGTIAQRDVLAFQNASNTARSATPRGTTAYVSNNNFFDNLQAPISVDPNGLLSTDPLRPLLSGNPFFRGNIMQRNELNGMEVLPEFLNNAGVFWQGYTANVFASTLWDDTDLTYILRSTLRLAGFEADSKGFAPLPAFPTGGFEAELVPANVLTIQSSLPDSPLANGQKVARPGESAIIKLLNTQAVLGDGLTGMPAGNVNADTQGGAGFIAGADDGSDPTADPLVDAGYLSQIRIIGIAGNQTSGQQRVPVIITSVRDDRPTVGRTVRGVDMFQVSSGNTTAPAPGDGGIILFGALGLSDYNLLDPRDGSIIDNADISFMTRIEQQGGGWVYNVTDGAFSDRIGRTPATQYNTAKALTISNSNIASFSQVGFIAHPSYVGQLAFFQNPPPGTPFFARAVTFGQPTLSFLVNNTFSNSPQGVRIVGDITVGNDAPPFESPAEAIVLNNTFFNNGEGLHLEGSVPTPDNPLAHVHAIAMDNIFANHTVSAVVANNRTTGSQGQYNLFSSNAADVTGSGPFANSQAVNGSPQFRNPATGDLTLLPNSDAIDSSRSEIGPLALGNSLQPIVDQQLTATTGIRRATGRTNAFGGLGSASTPGDIISLPGFALRNYKDQWVPAITGTPGAIPGPTTNAGGTFSFIPISGERDQSGQLRMDDPNRANVGFGSRPFFDIGANEFVQLNPPHITQVTAIINNPFVTPDNPAGPNNPARVQVPFYTPGGITGANQTPLQIIFQLDQRLDQATVNNKTIILQAANGDGIFDNGNDKLIDLAGKLTYDALRQIFILALGDSNLSLSNDVYRIQVFGSGGNVIRNPQGLALDGENTVGGAPNAPTLPLPSGDLFPGGNFFLPFTIDTNPPQIVGGSFALASQSDTGARDNITSNSRPSFVGTVTDIAPPANPLINQTAIVDVSTKGDGIFDRLGVATGKSDVNGNFTAVFDGTQPPLPETSFNVGPDGILGTADDTGYSVARVRLVDTSGNSSSLTDSKALVRFVIDTKGPRVTAASPLPGSQSPTSGTIPVSIVVNENLAPATVNTTTIRAVRAGGDGIFGNGNDVPVTVDAGSLILQNLGSGSGSQIVRFNLTGATVNDLYQVTLVGSGSGVTDVAGNLLDGEGNSFPSGNGTPGGDFNLQFIVFSAASSRILYVGKAIIDPTAPLGSRNNPFSTISAPMSIAQPGDTVAVISGTTSANVYTESVTLRSLVRLVSADPSSTDALVVPGNALRTVLRAPANGTAPTTTIQGDNLVSIPAFSTEVSGFSIASPLVGDSARGPINTGSFGMLLNNSDVLVSKNYVVDSGVGIGVNFGGANAVAPRFESNGIIGNTIGLLLNDVNTTSFRSGKPIELANNTFAFNNHGFFQQTNTAAGPVLTDVVNNIFWQNAAKPTRSGNAIVTNAPNRMTVRNNIFSGNGPSDTNPADDTVGVGGGFNPGLLKTTPDALGNFTGNPSFVSPIDPRPEGQGPGNFFLGANYDLQANSAAIDVALASAAPALDFKSRGRVDIANVGRTGVGPADIGAFEFNGSTTPGGVTGGVTRAIVLTSSDANSAFVSNSTTVGTVSSRSTTGATAAVTVAKPAAKATAKQNAKTRSRVNQEVTDAVPNKPASKPTGPIAAARRFFLNKKGR